MISVQFIDSLHTGTYVVKESAKKYCFLTFSFMMVDYDTYGFSNFYRKDTEGRIRCKLPI